MQYLTTKNSQPYKALPFLCMLAITILSIANVLIYRLVYIGDIIISAGTFIIPFWYILEDIIAEVYGYQRVRQIIWMSIICSFIFATVCAIANTLPIPPGWQYAPAFDLILGKLPRVFLGLLLAIVIGAFLNAILLTKWKILTHGKYYWIRSLGSSAIGQLCFTSISLGFDLFHYIPMHTIAQLILVSYAIKLIFTAISIVPATLITSYLKKLEGIDVYDYSTDFNPFKLLITEPLSTGSNT